MQNRRSNTRHRISSSANRPETLEKAKKTRRESSVNKFIADKAVAGTASLSKRKTTPASIGELSIKQIPIKLKGRLTSVLIRAQTFDLAWQRTTIYFFC
jgi:hypothetical protein